MLKKSLLLLTTAMLVVPSTASFADKKDDKRERARQEAPARPHAKEQRAQRNQARPQRMDRRDVAAPSGSYRKAPNRAKDGNDTPRTIPPRNVRPQGRDDRQARPDRQRKVTHVAPSPVRDRPERSSRDDRRQPTREVRSVNRRGDDGIRNRTRTIDRRDVAGSAAFNTEYKRRTNGGSGTYYNRGGRNASYDDNRRRNDNNRRVDRDNHRSRDRDRDRDHRYDHRDRRDHRYYRDRNRSNTRIYIGFGTYPYGYWGRNHYYGHYSYGDWPFYSGYWHTRAHWAWHTHHHHYHYGGYCPGVSRYSTTYYYDEPTYYSGYSSNAGNEVAGTILGGVIGGILGSEIDGGRNRTAGIVVGSLLGATVGNSIARSNSRTVSSYRYTPEVDYYYDDDPDAYRYESESNYAPPSGAVEVRKCIEYDVRAGNYVCRRWIVEYEK